MRDCYKILGVPPYASLSEIRSAYRKKAKILHPDLAENPDDKAFNELQKAYEILTDSRSRQIFDEKFKFNQETAWIWKPKKDTFDYRLWLLERNDDESMAKLIVFDLMRGNEEEAVTIFKKMNMERPGFKMSRWFTREDFMDYGFILSEELVLRQEYYDAVIILEQVIKMNYSYDYFRLFFPEVLGLARHILRNNIEGQLPDELALDAWERALELNLGKSDDAFFLEKMADIYERMGDIQTADICRTEALNICRK